MRLRRKNIAVDPPPPAAPVVQPYDDGDLRRQIKELEMKLCAAVDENARLVKKLIEMESKPDEPCSYSFDIEYNDDLTIRRIVSHETSVVGSSAPQSSKTLLYG